MTDFQRRDRLYEFLEDYGGWIRQEVLFAWLPITYPTTGAEKNPHNCVARRRLTDDIKAINADPTFEKVIIHGNKGVKIATREEANAYFAKKYRELTKGLTDLRVIGRKIGLDGQIDLKGNVVEAFAGE